MDPAIVLPMLKQLIEEQRNLALTMMKEQRDIITKIMDRAPQRDQGAVKPEEQATLPNVMAALSNRIEKFVFDPDADMSFSKWFSKYKSEIRQVPEACPTQGCFPNRITLEAVKQLFGYKTSLFTTTYQYLKLEKSDAELPDVYWSCERIL
ncbi:hypothetical protein GCK32_015644 [Trichostrongylus colubriformis]|uniref:DUF7083 domain-containing protein n=1 Tax=Trichostrongylus colubriformis TaxID=6319 RepID=A0AAN8F132_TRICO